MLSRVVLSASGHSRKQMELSKASCFQYVTLGCGSTVSVASRNRRSWLSSGRNISRWRSRPTGLWYVYSVVWTMRILAIGVFPATLCPFLHQSGRGSRVIAQWAHACDDDLHVCVWPAALGC